MLAFKERVFDVIEFEPNLLSTVEGIGPLEPKVYARIGKIKRDYS